MESVNLGLNSQFVINTYIFFGFILEPNVAMLLMVEGVFVARLATPMTTLLISRSLSFVLQRYL